MEALLSHCVRSDGERLDPALSPAPSVLAEDGRGTLYARRRRVIPRLARHGPDGCHPHRRRMKPPCGVRITLDDWLAGTEACSSPSPSLRREPGRVTASLKLLGVDPQDAIERYPSRRHAAPRGLGYCPIRGASLPSWRRVRCRLRRSPAARMGRARARTPRPPATRTPCPSVHAVGCRRSSRRPPCRRPTRRRHRRPWRRGGAYHARRPRQARPRPSPPPPNPPPQNMIVSTRIVKGIVTMDENRDRDVLNSSDSRLRHHGLLHVFRSRTVTGLLMRKWTGQAAPTDRRWSARPSPRASRAASAAGTRSAAAGSGDVDIHGEVHARWRSAVDALESMEGLQDAVADACVGRTTTGLATSPCRSSASSPPRSTS